MCRLSVHGALSANRLGNTLLWLEEVVFKLRVPCDTRLARMAERQPAWVHVAATAGTAAAEPLALARFRAYVVVKRMMETLGCDQAGRAAAESVECSVFGGGNVRLSADAYHFDGTALLMAEAMEMAGMNVLGMRPVCASYFFQKR